MLVALIVAFGLRCLYCKCLFVFDVQILFSRLLECALLCECAGINLWRILLFAFTIKLLSLDLLIVVGWCLFACVCLRVIVLFALDCLYL